MNEKIVDVISDIKSLTQMELKELKDELEKAFGVTANVAVFQKILSNDVVEEAQTEFDFILKSFGTNKIAVIKALRQCTGLGLIESKAAVEGCPVTVKEGVSSEEAEKWKVVFEQVGAVVEIK